MPSIPVSAPRVALLLLALGFVGCASSYTPVDYSRLEYTGQQTTEGLTFAYRYEAQPGYYGEKTNKRGYDLIAVRVTNTLETPVTLDAASLRIAAGGVPASPVRPRTVADNSKQPIWTYLLWNLANVTVYDGDGDITAFIPVGAAISVFNMVRSSGANGKMKDAYVEEYLLGRSVAPGETVEGLLFLSETGYAPLTFEYVGAGASAPAAPASVPN